MKTSERLLALSDFLKSHGNKCRPRDPVLSASLRNISRDLVKRAAEVEALERAYARACELKAPR